MGQFEDRQKGQEAKFAFDAEKSGARPMSGGRKR